MLSEPALSHDDRLAGRSLQAPARPEHEPLLELRPLVEQIMTVERSRLPGEADLPLEREDLLMTGLTELVGVFEGRLHGLPAQAYEHIDALLAPHGLLPLLRRHGQRDALIILQGRPNPGPRSPLPNVLLLLATVFSLLFLGTLIAAGEVGMADGALASEIANNPLPNLWRGLPYAASLLLILGAHELGHYFAARRGKVAVSLPYFIPLPFPLSMFGTAGAFIQLRAPIRSRRTLLDIGASGPLLGLVFAIPIVLLGLATSPVGPVGSSGWVEGNSLMYALSKTVVFGRFLPAGDIDVTMNQLAQAGWTGLLVTAINLIPLGQLDGGHIMYALFGRRARLLYVPVLIAAVALTLFVSQAWLLWLVLLFLLGRFYAVPLEDITPLDRRRQVIGVLALVAFVVTFVPIPFALREMQVTPGMRESVSALLPVALVLMALWRKGGGLWRR
jgi:membrane-associated protease RseP (regulator of RpoE activity)